MSKIGVAVVGYGRMGLIHARNVYSHPKLELKYIVGTNQNQVEQIASQFNNVTGTTDYNQVLNDPQVKGVVICSPSGAHFAHITEAAKAGKAIFCEKPVALTEEEISKCFDAAEEHKVALLCGYQRRFDKGIKKIHDMIPEKLGDIQLLRLTSRDHPPPPEEYLAADSTGSFFDDFSTHDVDIARWMVGEDPSSIYATASSFMGGDDTAVIVLKFPNGALCVIDNSRQTSYGYDVRMEVLGPKGMATLTNPKQSPVIYSSFHGHSTDTALYSFPERFSQAYKSELDHWVNIIENNEAPRVTRKDCIQACKITGASQTVRLTQLPFPDAKKSSVEEPEYPRVEAGSVIGVIIFGTGRMGRVRAKALRQIANVEVLYGFDIIESSVKSFAEEFSAEGHVLNDESMAKALADPKVKAVFVSTTSSSHQKIISACLNAGKHVFCEKPLALTAADTESCVQLAKEKNLALYCGFQRRSDVHFRQLKKSITGVKQLVRITSREPASNSGLAYLLASGGFLFDSVIHDFDMAIFLTGEYPFEVYCQANAFNPALKEAGDVDAIVVILRFPSGVIASIDNHRNAVYGYDQRAEVHTSTGQFSTENLGYTTVTVANGNGFTTDNPPDCLARYDIAYAEETRHFIALLKGEEKEPRSPINDYTVTAKIAEAARASLASGKPVPFTP